MRATPFAILLFFVCLNLSIYFVNETQILPNMEQPPYSAPEDIATKLVHVDTSGESLLAGILGSLAVASIVRWLTGRMIYGGTVAIILFAMNLLFPIVRWLIFGFPLFMDQMGVHTALTTVLKILIGLVWTWFIIGFVGQRQMET